LSLSSATNESARHLEVTASHVLSAHETHVLPTTFKLSVVKHQAHGLIPSKASHHAMARPYVDLHRGDHHRE
jgi:hypothetical protein